MNISVIGLGHMGLPMAANLHNTGYQVMGYDQSSEAMQSAQQLGMSVAHSLAETVQDADVIITMLQTGEQVTQVCCAEQGVFKLAKMDTLLIDSSSIAVSTSRKLHEQAAQIGLDMLDAPVSGGVAGAEAGQLTIMVGGKQSTFERALPIFNILGKKIIHVGAAGNGQVAKLCNNMVLGISMIAVSEAFTLAKTLGVSPETLFEVCSNASGKCWVLTHYPPVPGLVDNVPANGDYQPGFTANMMLKDLHLSQDAADTAQVKTLLGATATQVYADFVEQGNGLIDFSAIIKMIASESK